MMKKKKTQDLSIQEVLRFIEDKVPLQCSEEWDNVGLLAGGARKKMTSAVVSIDLTQEAIDLAIRKKANLIINHHPCIFPKSKGLARVTDVAGPGAELVYQAIAQGISVAAYHTNFDQCALEVVKVVSHGLGVEPKGRLIDKPKGALTKLVVFVPRKYAEAVRQALCEAGAGQVSNYDHCSFSAEGIGTFRGNQATRPFLGSPGKLERAEEVRLETIFPSGMERKIVDALLTAHPYEEVAYDLYALKQGPERTGIVPGLGYGFWGEYKSALPFSEVVKSVTHLFDLDGFLLTNPPPKRIKRLAYAAGKGSSFIDAALASGCDLLITGETGYHDALSASRRGMAVMELGHRESERFFLTTMEGWLTELGVRTSVAKTPTQRIWS